MQEAQGEGPVRKQQPAEIKNKMKVSVRTVKLVVIDDSLVHAHMHRHFDLVFEFCRLLFAVWHLSLEAPASARQCMLAAVAHACEHMPDHHEH